VEQEIVYLYVSLLIVEFMDLQAKSVLGEGNLHLFPYFELSAQIHQHSYHQINLVQKQYVFVSHLLLLLLGLDVQKL
jgi:hypothetical protein